MAVRLVSQQLQHDLDVARAKDDVLWAVRRVAAQILRISSGSGDELKFVNELIALTQVMNACLQLTGETFGDGWIKHALDAEAVSRECRPWFDPKTLCEHEQAVWRAKNDIVKYALRSYTAALLDQKSIENANHSKMIRAIHARDAALDRRWGRV